MKILLLGLYDSRNLGDAVLCDCTKAVLEEAFPEAEIVIGDLLGRTEFDPYGILPFSPKEQKKNRLRNSLRDVASRFTPLDRVYDHERQVLWRNLDRMKENRISDADAVVFAGGQVLTDTLALEAAWLVRPYLRRGTPIFFNACGTGKQVSPHIRGILREILADPAVRYISVRDHAREVSCKYGCRAGDVFDFGLFAPQVYGVRLPQEPSPMAQTSPIGLGFMYPSDMDEEKVRNFWMRLIAYLEEMQIPWRAFCNGSGRDMGFAGYVLRSMPKVYDEHRTDLEAIPQTPADLVRTVTGFRGILSFRLHSHILAASLGVPSVAFVWDDKVNEFFRKMGCPERSLAISAKPRQIWQTYLAAEKEGWNRSLIAEGLNSSRGQLIDAVLHA
ncbi:MAG: polysaccharide pyruvyl transferase family protein [Lachnospiraceae bacterium]|nr:polysaccharide pyruvyl transferase family protein [Lachnospiraceae bacterium]